MAWNRDSERKAGKAMTIGGCIYGIVFMVFWCGIAVWMGAWFMLIFGIPMLGFMVFRLVMCIKKANEDKRSRDPWDQPTGGTRPYGYSPTGYERPSGPAREDGFCPYCGEETKDSFEFCPKCGRRLP